MEQAPRRSLRLTNVLLAMLVVAIIGAPTVYAFAQSQAQPANKAVASGRTVQAVPVGPTTGAGTDANNIMTATVKTSKPEDLILEVSLECSILTQASAQGSGTPGSTSTGEAEGKIRVWVVVDDTYIVPIQDTSSPPQNTHGVGNDNDKTTFCNRLHRISVTDAENLADGTDTVTSYINTKDANAFNWLALNLGSGVHTIDVRADLETNTVGTGSQASGFVGNRTLIVEPTKLANNAVIS